MRACSFGSFVEEAATVCVDGASKTPCVYSLRVKCANIVPRATAPLANHDLFVFELVTYELVYTHNPEAIFVMTHPEI